jgi:phosphatidylserine/phosphatidylglycerophosphate/cardiolipin synthase-like enzyme/uncharacterized membrane protein YdjX (TVP38/TMEM64 family)
MQARSTQLGVSRDAEREVPREPILVEGDTCWKRVRAERAAVLVDAADYFAALRASLLKAERSVFILGWELHSRTPIEGNTRPQDGAPIPLGPLLKWLLRRRPQLQIRILLWNHPVLFAIKRELFPRRIFERRMRRVEILLDSHLPVGASHHEKIVIIDDNVAYCGGIDLTVRRWDTTAHHPAEPRRCCSRKPYKATHDVQMVVDGAAAAALGRWARRRWRHAGGKGCPRVARRGDAWPGHVTPDFTNVDVGIMRTIAALEERTSDIREIERATVAALSRAERFVYIENQYLTSKVAFDALSARMRAVPDLEVVVLTTHDPGGWLEAEIMGAGRQRFMAAFDDAALAKRIRFVSPAAACAGMHGDEAEKPLPIHVHAKVLIVDDAFIRIGSSNLNNRSMGFDTECDLAIEAASPEQRRAILDVRNRLIAEHWGSDADAVARALATDGLSTEALAELPNVPVYSTAHGRRRRPLTPWRRAARAPATRTVVPLEREETPASADVVIQLGDPERAVSAAELAGQAADNFWPRRKLPLAVGGLALVLVLAGLASFGLLDLGAALVDGLESLGASPWRVPIILAAFVVGSIVVVPILAMIGATVLVLGPVLGFACSAVGVLLAASATFGIGRVVGREPLRRWLGERLDKLERQFTDRGIVAIALIRKVPVAPFTIVNMLIGAIGVRYRDFIVGTALGMIPGIAAFAFVSDRFLHAWRDPTPQNVALTVTAMLLWIGIVLLVQRVFNRHAKR